MPLSRQKRQELIGRLEKLSKDQRLSPEKRALFSKRVNQMNLLQSHYEDYPPPPAKQPSL